MKTKLLSALLVSLIGVGLGVYDAYQALIDKRGQYSQMCPASPEAPACLERTRAAANVRYVFNGYEYRNGTSVTEYAANQ